MRHSYLLPAALLCVLAIGTFAGCGGEDGSSGGPAADPAATVTVPATATITVDQFKSGFLDETGIELTADDFPGGAKLLAFDDDGDAMMLSDAEKKFAADYGTPQILVTGKSEEADLVFNVSTGKTGQSAPVPWGDGGTARIDTTVAAKPDADGVTWSKKCVVRDNNKSSSVCGWTGTKRYGQNVVVSWSATTDSMDEASSRLDAAVAAVVSGA